jgi:hypothetical protein
MAHSSWGPGWPNCQTGRLVTVSAGGRRWTLRREVAPIFAHFIDEIVGRGYRISAGQLDDWSFACRAIAGTRTPSNHSWGLAVDINSLTNPMTFDGRLVTDMPRWVVECATAHGLNWGGNYGGAKKDAMHFEWLGSLPAAVAKSAALSGAITAYRLELTVGQYEEIMKAINEVRADVWKTKAQLDVISGAVHGTDDSNRDGSILLNTTYLRSELLGGDNAQRLREILRQYGVPKAAVTIIADK